MWRLLDSIQAPARAEAAPIELPAQYSRSLQFQENIEWATGAASHNRVQNEARKAD
jgi:hypothetical protein